MFNDSHKNYLFDLRDNLIYKRLTDIRKQPALWLKKKSLTALDYYIRGFYDAYIHINSDETDWIPEFFQYVCDICVNGNGSYGSVNAIFACGYDDETGFDYYYSLLDDYIIAHAVVDNRDILEKVDCLRNEIRMVYIDWEEIPVIVDEYVSRNRNRLFHLIGNETLIKYKSSCLILDSHEGIVFSISDTLNSGIGEQMEEYAKTCQGTVRGICYKAINLNEKKDI
ncbi:MAG: hypothetical protein Q4C91_05090 [Eubacteriales bacterium]|nr:hypothetical protein [Eubacteriales bacterium]